MAADALEAGIVGLDRDRLTPFYVDAVGFILDAELDYPQGVVHRLSRGPARMKIFYPSPPAHPRAPTERWHDEAGFRYAALYLSTSTDVHELAERVARHGGRIVTPATEYGAAKTIALVADPEDNVLELIWER
ncbi:MAG: VOC family protein [Acidimicrobiia bacterium]|nr:VOC family protein [Acidimicrobiia bacterium]